MCLFDGAVAIPLTTAVDYSRAVRTIKRLRIPAQQEVVFSARPLRMNPCNIGITETLPSTLARGLKVAVATENCCVLGWSACDVILGSSLL